MDGTYSVNWIPTATGAFILKAGYAGSSEYAGCFPTKPVSHQGCIHCHHILDFKLVCRLLCHSTHTSHYTPSLHKMLKALFETKNSIMPSGKPRLDEMAEEYRAQETEKIEQQYLSGKKDANLGIYCDLFSAKTGVDGQDGGVVTALLLKGLKDGTFDAVLVVNRTEGYTAQAIATTNPEEVYAARGTKYLKISVLPKLRKLVAQGKRRIAVSCTPCEARAARKLEQNLKQKIPDLDIAVIGLFCLEAFNAARLKGEVQRLLNIDLDKAEKTEIRKGKFLAYIAGKEFSCKIRELSDAAEKGCHFCDDFTSMLADVSVGSVGSQSGYSTVIVRSEKGKRLLENLDAVKAPVEQEEIVKLSKFKQERAKKSFVALKNQH